MSDVPHLRLLVLSDLHATTAEADAGGATRLSFHGSAAGVERMFGGLQDALRDAEITGIDAVLCPGDLTDRADPAALAQVWGRLGDLADKLGAALIATAGNHDHDSRANDGTDPRRHLKDLDPPFPARNQHGRLEYFTDNFTRIDLGGTTIVTLNSGALGGLTGPDGDEYKHGRVQPSDMKRLRESLKTNRPQGVRVLVVHHHPVQLPYIDLNESSLIRGVEHLLDVIDDDGQWLIAHGHKHRPWVHYAPGGGGSAVLFSAGSFSAPLDGVLAQSTKNQFYVIDVAGEEVAAEFDLGVAGSFRAWSFSPYGTTSWVPSGATDGLPAVGGFGWRTDPWRVAKKLVTRLKESGNDASYEDVLNWEPRVKFLAPNDLLKVIRHIPEIAPSVVAKLDENGCIERLSILEGRA